MDVKEYEKLIRNEITTVINNIVKDNKCLEISSKSRSGAEISDFLEKKFVEYTKDNERLLNSEPSPIGSTKNPWDARTFYKYNDHIEEIWIDFKAFKLTSNSRSNPDIGTPDKIFKFIEKGGFYLLYVYVYYIETENGMEFVEYQDNLVKSYFLKDVSSKVRRTTSNQLQVSINDEPEYRTRSQFISFLKDKVLEGLHNQIKNAELKIKELSNNKKTLKLNKLSEQKIISL